MQTRPLAEEPGRKVVPLRPLVDRENDLRREAGDPEMDPWAAMSEQRWLHVHDPELPVSTWFRMGVSEDGRLVCTGLLLGGDVPDEEVTTSTLRGIPVAQLLAEVERMAKGEHGALAEAWAREVGIGRADRFERPKVRPGRRGHPREHYEEVARRYLEALRTHPHKPTAHLAQTITDPDGHPVAPSTVRRWLERAEQMGLLNRAEPGKARVAPPEED